MMTDNELKELIASLAVSHKKARAEMDEMHALEKEFRVGMNEMHALEKEFRVGMNEMQVLQKNARIEMDEIQAIQKETSRKLNKLAKMIGGIGTNQGDVAENFFYNSFVKNNHLGEFSFDEIIQNIRLHKGQTQEEYDLLLINGESIVVIEVKYKAHREDVKKLARKANNFKYLFPIYRDYNVYGAMASFHFNQAVKTDLLEEGYFVVERSGKLIQTKSAKHLKLA